MSVRNPGAVPLPFPSLAASDHVYGGLKPHYSQDAGGVQGGAAAEQPLVPLAELRIEPLEDVHIFIRVVAQQQRCCFSCILKA